MITIELKRILREGVIIALILAALVTGILTTDKDIYLVPALEIFLLLYAAFAGWSLFDRERNEGAMEYLMSLPVSRTRLFRIKFIPRLLSVSFLLLVYMLLYGDFGMFSLVPFLDFAVVYTAFFLVSMSFSLSIKSFIGAFFLTSLLTLGLAFITYVIEPERSILSVLFQANLLVLVFPVLFFLAFQRFDIKPVLSFNRRFLFHCIGGVLFVAAMTYFLMADRWCCYTLTQQGEIFRASRFIDATEFSGKTHVHRLPGHLAAMQQDGRFMYCMENDWKDENGERASRVMRLNLDSGNVEYLAEFPGFCFTTGVHGRSGVFHGSRIYFLMVKYSKKEYSILEVERIGTGVREIPIVGKIEKGKRFSHLAFVNGSPLQFYIFSHGNLYRFDGSGGALDSMIEANGIATWKNRLLAFNKEGMTLYDVNGGLKEVFKKTGSLVLMDRKFDGLGSTGCRWVIYRDRGNGGYYCFDLKDTVNRKIKLKTRPYDYLEVGGKFLIVSVIGYDITVDELREGKIVNRHKWTIDVGPGWRRTQAFPAGIIVNSNKEYNKFLFKR